MFLIVLALDKCQIGEGVGGTEVQLSGEFTKENCIIAVKEQYPTANGATMDAVCPSECRCWAEFGMESWSGSSYTSCMFIQGEQCAVYSWAPQKGPKLLFHYI